MKEAVTFLSAFSAILALSLVVWVKIQTMKLKRQIDIVNGNKSELETILQDASSMIQELNSFSDYIVTQMDLKNRELWNSLKRFDDRLDKIKHKHSLGNSYTLKPLGRGIELNSSEDRPQPITKKESKVVSFNQKYNQVVNLAADGYTETEIAKRLKIGKGEIQLVLGLCK